MCCFVSFRTPVMKLLIVNSEEAKETYYLQVSMYYYYYQKKKKSYRRSVSTHKSETFDHLEKKQDGAAHRCI